MHEGFKSDSDSDAFSFAIIDLLFERLNDSQVFFQLINFLFWDHLFQLLLGHFDVIVSPLANAEESRG